MLQWPMAFQRVPNTVEIRCICDWNDQEFVTTFYARTAASYNAGDVGQVHEAVGEAWRDSMMLHLTSDVTFDRSEVRDLNTEFGFSESTEYNVAGTQAPPTAPPQLAVLITFTGDSGAAPRRGRHFISGVKQAVYDDETGLWLSSIRDSIVVAEGDITDAISAAGALNFWARVLVSRTLNKELRAEAVTNTLADTSGRLLPGSQRDRRPTIGS